MTIDETAARTGAINPYLSGAYEPVQHEVVVDGLEIIGELPAALNGTFIRNGPNPQFAPLGKYHIFDGDGMLHAVSLSEGRASYRNRWVESKGLLAERKRGRALFGGLSEFAFPDPEISAEIGGIMKNTANTNIVGHAGRLFALMEAVPPTEIAPGSLATLGEFDFDGRLDGSMTAHPRPDPATGELHFFGAVPFPPFLRYHVVDAAGTLTRSVDIDLGRAEMMHDFVITESNVIFFSLPALFDIEAMMSGGAGIRWDGDAGARIGVLPRDGGTDDVAWYEIDPCFVFHFLNAWDEPDGRIVIDGCRSERMNVSFGDDDPVGDHVVPSLHRWEIDPRVGRVSLTQLDDRAADFPRVPDSMTGRPNRYGTVAHSRRWHGDGEVIFDGVTQHDLHSGTSVTYRYGETAAAGEPVFAPDPEGSGERDGWYVNLVTDLTDRSARFVVIDARDITAGPVAEVLLPERVPFGFHGNWFPDT